MKKNDKSPLMAVVFFAAMTIIGALTCQAQVNLLDPIHSPDTNPLLSTTGPNTIGKGHLQLSGQASWFGFSNDWEEYATNGSAIPGHDYWRELGGGIGLRYGIGNRFELFANMSGAHARDRFAFSFGTFSDTLTTFTPSLGLKMMLFEGGHGWEPQVSAYALIDVPMVNINNSGFDVAGNGGQPVLGLQFRNRLGRRWALDYGASYRFNTGRPIGNTIVYALQRDKPFQFNIMARWLATDRLMVSAGMENVGGVAEVLWQATPTLQLKAQGGLAAGVGFRTGMLETNALMGINWMLK